MNKINLLEFKLSENLHGITEEERISWWGESREEFFSYTPEVIAVFDIPKPWLYKQGIQSFIRHVEFAEANPFMVIPSEDKTWRYVVQMHFRGRSAHFDLRLERENDFIGWTIFEPAPEMLSTPVTDLEGAKKVFNSIPWLIDFNAGKLRDRAVKSGDKGAPKRAELLLEKKLPGNKAWLDVNAVLPPGGVGATVNDPGVFLIVDKGRVEYGAAKPDFNEYFLSGGKLKGRFLCRTIKMNDVDKWVMIQPDDQKPYAISPRAFELEWLPPFGYSALPESVRKNIPSSLKYWEMKDKADALSARGKLLKVNVMKGGD